MPTTWKTRMAWALAAIVIVAALTWFAWPKPVPVDLAGVARAPMEVTVDDE